MCPFFAIIREKALCFNIGQLRGVAPLMRFDLFRLATLAEEQA